MSTRRTSVTVFLVLGTVALALSIVAGFVRDTLVDSSEFADKSAAAIATPEVREVVVKATVDQMVAAEPELLAVRPILETVVDGVLGSDLATDIIRAGVADLHRTVFTGADDTLTVQLADLILVAKSQLTALDPELGALIPDDLTDAIVSVETRAVLVDATQLAETLQVLAFLMPVLTIVAFAAAIWRSDDGIRTLVHVGVAAVSAAAAVLVAERVARLLVTSGSDDDTVARAIWDAFTVDLGTWLLVVAGTGAVVSAVAWFGFDDIAISGHVERLGRLVRHRTGRRQQLVWGALALVVGLFVILNWQVSLRFVVTVGGAVLVGAGVREVLVAVAPGLMEGAGEDRDADLTGSELGTRVLALLAVLVLGGVAIVAVWQSADGGDDRKDVAAGCNGAEALCTRGLDEIVLAATHNSNAAAEDGYVNGFQTVGIVPQLQDGIRGLLIDIYFGFDAGGGVVVTDRAPVSPAERDELVAEIGESAVRSAEAIREDVATAGGERSLYLCHALCEIGATPLVDELREIKKFLDDNPREVLVVIIQDEGPLPDDIAEAFAASGLDDLVYTHDGERWPTLGEMIDAGTRVFVSAENRSGGPACYHEAFVLVQDTPFGYKSLDEFDCAPNRGEPDSPLLLVNHWLSPVSPRAADEANDASVLRSRAVQCIDDRGMTPNLIAVDFHDRGDLVKVVAELNAS